MAVYLTDEDFKKLKRVLKKDKELYSEVSEIMPLLKEGLEEGKYYSYKDEIFFKAVKITEDDEVWGYGLVNGKTYHEDGHFASPHNYKDIEEIAREDFLQQIAKYAVDVLGFKEGVKYYIKIGGIEGTVKHEPIQFYDVEALHCGEGQGLIFKDGKFAEIIEQPKEDCITYTGDDISDSIWMPTSFLRYKRYSINNVLEQKWVETNTGAEKWREIETI